jgi:hypothetical protein
MEFAGKPPRPACIRCREPLALMRGWTSQRLCERCWGELLGRSVVHRRTPGGTGDTLEHLAHEYSVSIGAISQKIIRLGIHRDGSINR